MRHQAIGRRAFTLIELMVSIVIGVLLMGVLYGMTSASTRTSLKNEGKTEAVQSALLAVETIKRDLRQLISLPVDPDPTKGVAGDARHPVLVSVDQREISFYIPMATNQRTADGHLQATAVNYRALPTSLAATPGLAAYLLGRYEGSSVDSANPDAGTGRVLGACFVRDIRFRLLDPYSQDPATQSPDANYYLETSLTGIDSKGKEEQFVRDLTPLDFPTQMAKVPNLDINQMLAYAPTAKLTTHVSLVSLTPAEKKAQTNLRNLAQDYKNGKITPTELEKKVKEIVDSLNKEPEGTRNVLVNLRNARVPTGEFRAEPPGPGPVVLKGPANTTVVVPSSPNEPVSTPQGNQNNSVTFTFWASESSSETVYGPDGKIISGSSQSANMSGGGSENGNNANPPDTSQVINQSQSDICQFFHAHGIHNAQCP